MEIHRNLNNFSPLANSVITIGSYDGIHRGHFHIVNRLLSIANSTDAQSVVITFNPRPRHVINNKNDTVSREELAEKEFDESELRKVDVGITRLRQKIEIIPKQPKHIKTIRGKGYMLICKEI